MAKSERIKKTVIIRNPDGSVARAYNQVEVMYSENDVVVASNVVDVELTQEDLNQVVKDAILADKAAYNQQIADLQNALRAAQEVITALQSWKQQAINAVNSLASVLSK